MTKQREPRTYLVASSYAGDVRFAWIRGAYSSLRRARKERDYLLNRLGPNAVVRVFDADRIPKSVTVKV